MSKENFSEQDIEAVLVKARLRNKSIGAYSSHTLTNDDYYTVSLTNGRILLFTAEIMNARMLLPDRINDISARFHETR